MDNKDFEIEVEENQQQEEATVQLPLNFLSFGEIETDDVKVYIKQDTYKALEKLASSDTSKELGSILIGMPVQEMGKTHVIISDFIEAKYTDASASTLTFTHETWDYVHKEHEKKFSDKKIIGWQHTHPNYGIFLSNYDMFIQENFFNLPFQIAYVIDPIQNIRGFFQWKNGKVEKLKGYYIYDEIGKVIKIEQTKVKKEKNSKDEGRVKKLQSIIVVMTLIIAVLAGSLIGAKSDTGKNTADTDAQIEMRDEVIAEQNEQIADQQQTIENLTAQLAEALLGGDGEATAVELIRMIEDGEISPENKQELLDELNAFVQGTESADGAVSFKAYTVVYGDTLSSVCKAHSLDYDSAKGMILAVNGIDDPNCIVVGQTIILPVVK